jgi:hypothetical protein
MEILTRELLEQQKKAMLEDVPSEKEWNEGCWEMKLINTALALYDKLENDILTAHDDGVMAGMKAFEKKVKGLIEKLKKERNAFNKEIGTESMVFIYDNIISDLEGLKEGG